MKNGNFSIRPFSFNINSVINAVKCNSNIILLISMFLCGLIFGSVSIVHSENYRYLFVKLFCVETEFMNSFVNEFLICITVLTCNFIMGLCLVGSPFISIMSVFEGIFIGSRYTVQLFINGYENIGRYILTNVVFYILMYIVFLYSQLLSVKMSESVKYVYCGMNRGEVSLRNYLIKYVVFIVCSVLICLLASIC